jgi:hypothetical protein
MKAFFNEKNKFIFDGHDVGLTLIKLMGDSDYEYHHAVQFYKVKNSSPF